GRSIMSSVPPACRCGTRRTEPSPAPLVQVAALAQRAHGRGERGVERLRLLREERLGPECVPDPAAEAELIVVRRLPERPAAGGTRERRDVAKDVLARDRLDRQRGVVALESQLLVRV